MCFKKKLFPWLCTILSLIAIALPRGISSKTKLVRAEKHITMLSMMHMMERFHVVLTADVTPQEEDSLLKEILAEEERETEEISKLEAEMRKLEEMKAQHREMYESRNEKKMKPGTRRQGNQKLYEIEGELNEKKARADKIRETDSKFANKEAEKEKNDEIARKREAAYEAELLRVNDEDARKALKRQKKRDNQVVKKILNNSKSNRHYAVLGLKCGWGEIKVGPLSFCNVSPGEVKRAYRKLARFVHPDKNRDGRAEEAFTALEESASILMDATSKREYDNKLRKKRQEALKKTRRALRRTWLSCRTVIELLGPFATPIAVLFTLMI